MSYIRKPIIQKGRFKNGEREARKSFMRSTMAMWFKALPRHVWDKKQSALHEWIVEQEPIRESVEPVITWIGHSTFLIQLHGFNILTDPIFFNLTTFYRRNMPPGIMPSQLPPLDVVLISHNHWDHMHGPSLMALRDNLAQRNGIVLVPKGDEQWFKKRSFKRVASYVWGEHEMLVKPDVSSSLKLTFLPAWHWSRRGLFDKNKSLWGSWMIEAGDDTIYFAGDTAYSNHFEEIRAAFPSINVALLPVGPCEPQHAMQHVHLNAHEAGRAFLDLGARTFIPMHWGTFNFGLDRFITPIEYISSWWRKNNIEQDRLVLLKVGERKDFSFSR